MGFRTLEIFACGIQTPRLWNPYYCSRKLECVITILRLGLRFLLSPAINKIIMYTVDTVTFVLHPN